MQNKEIKVSSTINFQPYFSQVVASNLVTAFFTGKLAYPEKSDEELYKLVLLSWSKLYELFGKIPTKTFPPEK